MRLYERRREVALEYGGIKLFEVTPSYGFNRYVANSAVFEHLGVPHCEFFTSYIIKMIKE